jgi:hypothetical protein
MQRFYIFGISSVVAVACGGTPEVSTPTGTAGMAGDTVAGSGGSSAGRGGAMGGSAGSLVFGGSAGKGGGAGSSSDPCDDLHCGKGQRCELSDTGGAACIDNTCEYLACQDNEDCVPASGGGNVCVPHVCDPEAESCACESDVNCPATRFCSDDGICEDDVCEPGTRRCDGDEVFVCASNGGSDDSSYTCSSLGDDRFQSVCRPDNPSGAGCTCEDDWDCPPDTVCDVGVCTGTGKAPTCTLPPVPFEDVPPALEFRWGGGTQDMPDAVGKAFPWSSQVLSTPMVVNLDDDNGDGKVNELDFPEIVFMTYYEEDPGSRNALVRAIHGGGPNKGEDFFAVCGSPAAPATPLAVYTDANGAYWSEGVATEDRHGAAAPVLCPNPDCPADSTCRNGVCVPVALTDCATDGDEESASEAIARPAGALAVGDLDYDGFPEIVVPTEDDSGSQTSGIQVLTNRGEVIFTERGLFPGGRTWDYAAPAIANLDPQTDCQRPPLDSADARPPCLAEIVVGNHVLVLGRDATTGVLAYDHQVLGGDAEGLGSFSVVTPMEPLMGPTACIADVRSDVPGLEIVAGTSLYQFDPALDALVTLWNVAPVPSYNDGLCAVADVWGADKSTASPSPGPGNPLDQVPEVIVISNGTLLIVDSQTGAVIRSLDLGGGDDGGAPNIDDFDGDGYPEIATALANFYTVVDLQDPEATNCPAWLDLLPQTGAPPGTNPARNPGGECDGDDDCNAGAVCNTTAGTCVCLHNGWQRDTEDDSSRATSSSIFDFNGDGAAEVVYNDECYFRVYDGATGNIYLATPSISRTIIENTVIADVDNDGNAEIILLNNNEFFQCSETQLDSWPDGMNDVPRDMQPNGISVYGDPTDTWVAARRVWNQHAYHVTNVLEGGGLPLHEPESWLPLHGRLYNSYRAQPRVYGVAPDLTLAAIQISSPGAACGELEDEIEITVLVRNEGDLRVGPGITVSFYGSWDGNEEVLVDLNGMPIVFTLAQSLEPGGSTLVTVTYTVDSPDGHDDLPDIVRAEIDAANMERECDETDNEIEAPVDPGEERADVAVVVVSGTCNGQFEVTVTNVGSDDASDILVRIYAGDPSAGGRQIGEDSIPGPLAPGESVTITVAGDAVEDTVTIWAVVDPLDMILECNDANNIDQGPTLECGVVR